MLLYPDLPTSWSVIARYNGEYIRTTSGNNPANGVFEIGAPSSYEENLLDVMTFKITSARRVNSLQKSSNNNTIKKSEIQFTEADLNKIKMANKK